jgi:hypothetical protein
LRVVLETSVTARVDLGSTPGGATTGVEVEAAAPLVNTERLK